MQQSAFGSEISATTTKKTKEGNSQSAKMFVTLSSIEEEGIAEP